MLSLIVAHGKDNVIGYQKDMPWHLPKDLAFFKKTTMGKPIMMGRNTFESIGRPLPGRENIVLTRNKEYKQDGVTVVHSIEDVLHYRAKDEELMIIGGATLYEQALPFVDKMYITYIDESFEGDTFFPEINEDEWKLVSEEKGIKDHQNPYDYYFRTYVRKH